VPDRWTPAFATRLTRLGRPHVLLLGHYQGECLACRVDGWATRARFAARAGYAYAPLAQLMLAQNGARIIRPTPVTLGRVFAIA
jgi:hypothetical protein